MLDCVCEAIFPARAATQFTQAQFHCGRAATGRAAENMDANQPSFEAFPVRSDRAGVTGAFEKDWHRFEHRFDPPLFRSHESLVPLSHMPYRSTYFLIKLISKVKFRFHTEARQRFKIIPECVHGPCSGKQSVAYHETICRSQC